MRMEKFLSRAWAAAQAFALFFWFASTAANAHEVSPSVADLSHQDGVVRLDIELVLEGFLARIDLSAVTDTNETEAGARYDELRALEGPELKAAFERFWPSMEIGRAHV